LPQPLTITSGSSTYFVISGYLNADSSYKLIDDVSSQLDQCESDIITLDFSDDAFINSMGMSGLVKLWEKCDKNNKKIHLYANENICHLLFIARIDQIMTIHPKNK